MGAFEEQQGVQEMLTIICDVSPLIHVLGVRFYDVNLASIKDHKTTKGFKQSPLDCRIWNCWERNRDFAQSCLLEYTTQIERCPCGPFENNRSGASQSPRLREKLRNNGRGTAGMCAGAKRSKMVKRENLVKIAIF